jgi:hypothetical protein
MARFGTAGRSGTIFSKVAVTVAERLFIGATLAQSTVSSKVRDMWGDYLNSKMSQSYILRPERAATI